MRHRCIDADDDIEIGDDGGGVGEIGDAAHRIAQCEV
jgi:hypothetical protein